MITEKRFVSSHHAFWRELLPMGEHYIRTVNQELPRFCEPLKSYSSPRFHGIVNELAFRLFVRSTREDSSPEDLGAQAIADELAGALAFIKSFRQHGRGPLPTPGEVELTEAIMLAQRTAAFFEQSSCGPLLTQPRFPGCGWLSECEGDVLASTVLYEIKAGDRPFRMQDVKQVLVYCALNFAAKLYDIGDICLVNPREGRYFSESLSQLCELISGRSAMHVLSDVVEYASQSDTGYGTG